jgi:hypothetical protein
MEYRGREKRKKVYKGSLLTYFSIVLLQFMFQIQLIVKDKFLKFLMTTFFGLIPTEMSNKSDFLIYFNYFLTKNTFPKRAKEYYV